MALRVLMLRKNLNDSKKEMEALAPRFDELRTRETEIEASIEEAMTDEERSAVEAAIAEFEGDKKALEEQKAILERKIEELEGEIAKEEEAQEVSEPEPAQVTAEPEEREVKRSMVTRDKIFSRMTTQERDAFVSREDVKAYLDEVRSCIREKRAITNVGLTIPEVILGVLRENIMEYSKLYKHVNVRPVQGEGRMVVMGTIPEGVWTECCANLNELTLGFNDVSVDCYKVAGYFAVCNANLEDSDIDLASELMTSIGQAIGLALDKAILYGRNGATTQNMPQGIVSRLVQTEAPTGYPATARTWQDLHTTNVLSIPAATKDAALFKQFILHSAAAKGQYSRGEKVWVMNETTYTTLIANAMVIDAGGAIVAGVNGAMPVIGGVIEVLNFVPDNVIIGGYFDLYLLAERRGQQFATSEHVRFLQDQTVMKGTARYDGTPMIAEAFVAIGLNGVTPSATMTFASDTANA